MARLEPTIVRREYEVEPLKRISWGAIFGGVVIAVAAQILLSSLGVAIGAGTIDPATGDTPGFGTLRTGAGIWWLISGILALFAGGWAAGKLAGLHPKMAGTLHGLVTWGLAMLVMIMLMVSMIGNLIGGAMRIVGAGASAVGQGVTALAPAIGSIPAGQLDTPDVAWNQVWNEAQEILRQTETRQLQPEQLREEAGQVGEELREAAEALPQGPEYAVSELREALATLQRSARSTIAAADKEALVNVLVARTDMSEAEARVAVDRWAGTFQAGWQQVQQSAGAAVDKVQATAAQAAEATASAVSSAAWWMFFYMLLTAAAAAGGAILGVRHGSAPAAQRTRDEPAPIVTT